MVDGLSFVTMGAHRSFEAGAKRSGRTRSNGGRPNGVSHVCSSGFVSLAILIGLEVSAILLHRV